MLAFVLAATLGFAERAKALSHHDWAVASTVRKSGRLGRHRRAPAEGRPARPLLAGGSILLGEGIAQGLKKVVRGCCFAHRSLGT